MTDFIESNMFRPSVPSEYLLKKPKKKLRVDENDSRYKALSALRSPEGPRFPGVNIALWQSVNNNNNNNSNCINNNYSSYNNNHSPSGRRVSTNDPESRHSPSYCENVRQVLSEGERESFIPCHGSNSAITHVPTSTMKTISQTLQPKGSPLVNRTCNSTTYPCVEQTILTNPTSEVLSGVPHQQEQINTQENASPESNNESSDAVLPVYKRRDPNVTSFVDLNRRPFPCTGPGLELSQANIRLVNVSDMQRQFTLMNLQRYEKDTTLLRSDTLNILTPSTFRKFMCDGLSTVSKDSSELTNSVETSVTEIEVIMGKNLHNKLLSNSSGSSEGTLSALSKALSFLQTFQSDKLMNINVGKRQRIQRLFRYLLGVRWKMEEKKESKEILVDGEVMDEDDGCEEGGGGCEKKRRPQTARPVIPGNGTAPVAAIPKRIRPKKKRVFGAGRRVRRSLGRGCRYIGHGLANITTYLPEAAYLGSVTLTGSYTCEFSSDDYITSDYM